MHVLSGNLEGGKNGRRALGLGKERAIHKIWGWGLSNKSLACDL